MPQPTVQPWYREVFTRARTRALLKGIGTPAFLGLFFLGYFAVLKYPLSDPIIMPVTWIDRQIIFTPAALPVYVSLWVYVSLPPAFLTSFRTLASFCLWIAAMCLLCLGLFWVFPTAMPPLDLDWAQFPEMALIKGVDQGGNACPSLHVASAVFCAWWLNHLWQVVRAPRILCWASNLHCLAILWSTMATRQHVFLDVIAGLLIGLAFGIVSLRHTRTFAAPGELGR